MNKDKQRVKKMKLLIVDHLKTIESMEDLKDFIKCFSKFHEIILRWDEELDK